MAFNWKFWKKNQPLTRELIFPFRADSFNNQYFGLGYDSRTISLQQALKFTPFARSIDLLSTQGSNVITRTLRVVDVKTRKPVQTRHADMMLSLLRESPDGVCTSLEWVRDILIDYLVYGNAIVWVEPTMGAGVKRMVRMNVRNASADMVDIHRGPESLIYELQPFGWTREPSMYHRSDIVHARYFPPDISYTSQNQTWLSDWPLYFLSTNIWIGLFADLWVKDFFDSAAKNDLIIKLAAGMGEEQQVQMLENFSIAQTNKRLPLVTPDGVDVKSISHTPQNADALEMRRHQIEEIGRFYGVPAPMLGLNVTQWGKGLEELSRMLWRTGTRLAVNTVLEQFSLRLLPRGQVFAVNASEEIRGDIKTAVAVLQATKPTTNGPALLTREEARELLGYSDPFKDDYGDWAVNIGKNLQDSGGEMPESGDDDDKNGDDDEAESDVDTDEETSDNGLGTRDNR